ncbi:MAG: hypothetical protein EZS28_047929, partial [Streblomastix strix]
MKIKTILVLICGVLILVLTGCVKRVTYIITWVNYDGVVLEVDSEVYEGNLPTYDSDTPTHPDSEIESFEFIGWEPQIAIVTSDQTYTAQYQSKTRNDRDTFTIIWINEDGIVLETDFFVSLNSIPTYDGPTPKKDSDSTSSF